jgi:non-ribosomal peptide synthetase component F
MKSNCRKQNRAVGEHLQAPSMMKYGAVDAIARVASASPTEERFWLLQELDGGSSAYNVPFLLKLTGIDDVGVVVPALNEMVSRHETLRTSFQLQVNGLTQVVLAEQRLNVPVLECRHVSATEKNGIQLLQELLEEESSFRFELSSPPLLRVQFIKMSESTLLLINMHHIITDGWSIEILISELEALCGLGRAQRVLAPLTMQYVDYTEWELNRLRSALTDRQIRYWKQQLAGLPACLTLPFDRPRAIPETLPSGVVTDYLDREKMDHLKQACRNCGVTPFMFLLAVFQVLLARESGQDAIAVGVPVANRSLPGTEVLIGSFVNTVVVRSDVCWKSTFKDLLSQIKATACDAYEHQNVPFHWLVREVRVAPPSHCHPLFQVAFAMQSIRESESREKRHIEFFDIEFSPHMAKFDLCVEIKNIGARSRIRFEYKRSLFNRSTVMSMLKTYGALIEEFMQTPSIRLSHCKVFGSGQL